MAPERGAEARSCAPRSRRCRLSIPTTVFRRKAAVSRGRGRRSVAGAFLAALAVAALVSGASAQDGDQGADNGRSGRWRTARDWKEQGRAYVEHREELDRLRSIGYVTGSRPMPLNSGVLVREPGAAAGLNLYTSGHVPGATLMDMDGNVLHTWRLDFKDAWPDFPEEDLNENAEYWRDVHLFENGDMLAIFEGYGMVKVDRESNIIWKHLGGEHHDMHVLPGGRIVTLTRAPKMAMKLNANKPILEDFVTILDADGNELRSVSVLGALVNSPYDNLMPVMNMPLAGDVLHTNSVQVLDGSLAERHPAFVEGRVLISMRTLSVIAVMDLESESIVWALSGLWREQHQPRQLPNGRILIFDNKGGDEASRVLEIDPVTQMVEWSYEGTKERPFYTEMCGANQRLANGNTLITESDYGRAFEVTPEGEIVWEYVVPDRAGKRNHLIATLFEMERVEPGPLLEWLD